MSPRLAVAALAVVVFAIVAVVLIDWRWKPLRGVLALGLLQIPLASANLERESAPAYLQGSGATLLLIALVLSAVGLAVVSQSGRFTKQYLQRWLPGVILLVAGAVVAMIAIDIAVLKIGH